MARGYDPNKDYSKELQRNDLSSSERKQLEQERQNKINDKYGGREPTMTGSNQKFSDVYKGSSGSSSSSSRPSYGSGGSTELKKGPGYVTGGYTPGATYGTPMLEKNPYYTGGHLTGGADMSRRPDLAGKYSVSNGYTVFYDDDGYAVRVRRGVVDYSPHKDLHVGSSGKYGSSGAWTDQEMLTAADQRRIQDIRAQMQAGRISGDEANRLANEIRSGYGYTIDKGGYVTDLRALSAIDQRRREWGLDANSPTAAQQNFLDLWYGGSGPQVDLMGRPIGGEQPSIDYDAILAQLGQGGFGGNFGGGQAPQYQGSQWDALLNQVANELASMNYENWTQGDQYKALADRYGQEGQLSMQNVLGQISSRTGGLASSYAATAAQQQYNDFMSQLEDVARQMYASERNDMLQDANMYRQLGMDDYNRFQNDLAQWNADRNFNYGAYRDSVADRQFADQMAWEREQYGTSLTQKNQAAAQDRIAAYLAAGGKVADLDPALIASSGLTTSELSAQQNYYAQQAAKPVRSGRVSGGGDSGKKMSLTVAKDMAKNGQFTAPVIDRLRDAGYTDDYIVNEYGWNGGAADQDYNSSYFNAAMSSMETILDQGRTENALQGLDSMWPKLSYAQRKRVQSMLSKYGIAYEGG